MFLEELETTFLHQGFQLTSPEVFGACHNVTHGGVLEERADATSKRCTQRWCPIFFAVAEGMINAFVLGLHLLVDQQSVHGIDDCIAVEVSSAILRRLQHVLLLINTQNFTLAS